MTTENNHPADVQIKQVYTVLEAAAILDVHTNTVYRLIKKRVFVSRKVGKSIRISKSSFDRWLNQL